jgi:hypothetical protein
LITWNEDSTKLSDSTHAILIIYILFLLKIAMVIKSLIDVGIFDDKRPALGASSDHQPTTAVRSDQTYAVSVPPHKQGKQNALKDDVCGPLTVESSIQRNHCFQVRRNYSDSKSAKKVTCQFGTPCAFGTRTPRVATF